MRAAIVHGILQRNSDSSKGKSMIRVAVPPSLVHGGKGRHFSVERFVSQADATLN